MSEIENPELSSKEARLLNDIQDKAQTYREALNDVAKGVERELERLDNALHSDGLYLQRVGVANEAYAALKALVRVARYSNTMEDDGAWDALVQQAATGKGHYYVSTK